MVMIGVCSGISTRVVQILTYLPTLKLDLRPLLRYIIITVDCRDIGPLDLLGSQSVILVLR